MHTLLQQRTREKGTPAPHTTDARHRWNEKGGEGRVGRGWTTATRKPSKTLKGGEAGRVNEQEEKAAKKHAREGGVEK